MAKKVVKKEAPKVEAPVKPEIKGTGRFEVLLDGEYFVVSPDGRIVSSGMTEESAKTMVKRFNK
jgi:hypothetical protein